MRVTGFNLMEASAEDMYEKGGEQTAGGILCKIRDLDSEWNSEEWTHIRWTDEQFCDKTKNCENGLDEPDFCQQVLITGSDARDGVYIRTGIDTYKQGGGDNIIFKEGKRWAIVEGSNQSDAVAMYKSGEGAELLLAGEWQDEERKESMPNLLIFDAAAKQILFSGSKDRDGVYQYHNATGGYKQKGGENWMFKEGDKMYHQEGKAPDNNGCKVQDLNSGGIGEEWTYITGSRYCNDHPDCERGEDEPASCHKHSYIVTGSKVMDGVYSHSSGADSKPNLYMGGDKFLLKRDDQWVLSKGLSEEEAFAFYKSRESKTVPTNGWQRVYVEGKKLGDTYGKSIPDLQIFQVISNLTKDHFETEEGLIFKMPEDQSKQWLFIPKGDEKKRQCNGVCECGSCVDEDNCAFHEHIKNTGFLVVRGLATESEQNGVYQLKKDSNGNYGFFEHLTSPDLIIFKKGDSWALGNGSSPHNATETLSTKGEDLPKIGWPVDIMRLNKVMSTIFSKDMTNQTDWETDKFIMCKGDNNQSLFIEKTGSDPFYCDKREHCPSGMDKRSCSILVDLTFEQPIFSAFGAVSVGILLFFVLRKSLKGRGERKRYQKVSQRLRRSINQIVDQARIFKKTGKEPDAIKADEETY